MSAEAWGKYLGLERVTCSENNASESSIYNVDAEALSNKTKATKKETRSAAASKSLVASDNRTVLLIPKLVEFLRLCWEDVSKHRESVVVGRKKGRT